MKTQAKAETIKRMQSVLDKLGVSLIIVWISKPHAKVHGEIEASSRTLFLYDSDLEQAWRTLIHETLEWKLKRVTRVYRTIINSLIESLEKVAYQQKEEFLEFLPEVFKLIEEERRKNASW